MAANICRESAELVQNTEGKCFRGGRAERLAGEGGQNHNLLWSCAHLKLSTGVTHVSGQSTTVLPVQREADFVALDDVLKSLAALDTRKRRINAH